MGEWFSGLQQALFEGVLQPLMFHAGLGHLLEDGFAATGWLLVGLLQIAVLLLVIGPLQRRWPVEAVTDRATIRTDMLYTLIHRLGLFRVALFFTVDPLLDSGIGLLRGWGFEGFHIDAWFSGLWVGVTDTAVFSFVLYLLVLDFVDYWMHRGQHQWHWWWQLHSLHHAQRQMTMWSDNRNHLLDDVLRDVILVVVAQLVGVAPGQFVAIVALTQLSESLQHANLRWHFGRLGERLWVSPRFHRMHHAIGIGHEFPPKRGDHGTSADGPPLGTSAPSGGSDPRSGGAWGPTLGGCNFGVLLPWWDMLFKTANFELRYEKTGVRDQVEPDAQGRLRDYGKGFWAQQWLGVRRLVGR
jgi:sterol desaturase/sphingolipid hydroxylase (fatty acid hydroxylase superfamily)